MYYRVRINKSQYRKNPLVLRNLGVRFEQDAINRPKGFPLWQLFYGVSGRGTFYLEGGQGILRPGQIVLLYPGEGHRYQSAAGDWLVHYIGFDGVLCQELLYTLGMTRSGIFSLSSPDAFLRHLKVLEGLMRERAPDCLTECSKELYALLLDLQGCMTRLPDGHFAEGSSLGREMILYLEEHYAEDVSMEVLARQFGRTPEYLCSCFKESIGVTVMRYLRRIRIHHAQVLLMTSPDLALGEVAEACGFHSSSYFCKVFRETTGLTPQAFRIGGTEKNTKP